ncbi:MAG: phenylpyruvate tautomerase MIF-related protein [Chromatiales bacterium]|nr:phenylpyruvate tautomerase MIF-related protein [Chromatiales bacterium]
MPYLLINTNQTLDKGTESALLQECSQAVTMLLGKPERYVMTSIESGITMTFGGDDSPCAYVELKSLGLPEARSAEFSQDLCELLSRALNVPMERIYIEFSSPPRHLWGWNGGTF